MSDYCTLFSQTFDGLLFSYLNITDVTWYVNHKFPVSFLLYITTKKNLTKPLLLTVLRMFLSQKITLARFACLCLSLDDFKLHKNSKGMPFSNVIAKGGRQCLCRSSIFTPSVYNAIILRVCLIARQLVDVFKVCITNPPV